LWEQITTGLSDGVLVNSRFTLAAFQRTFHLLAWGGLVPRVLYPCIDTAGPAASLPPPPSTAPRVLLSINRFERKKEVAVAIRAFAAAVGSAAGAGGSTAAAAEWHMVVAGGYDTRLEENVAYFEELCKLAGELGLLAHKQSSANSSTSSTSSGSGIGSNLKKKGGQHHHQHQHQQEGLVEAPPGEALPRGLLPGFSPTPALGGAYAQVLCGARITFVRSFSDAQKTALLGAASAIAYTPPNEHFGIVPLECMAAGRPVVCDASGGPLESVVPPAGEARGARGGAGGATGWLCAGGQAGWDAAIANLIALPPRALGEVGRAGRAHVQAHFSRGAFARALEGHCVGLVRGGGGGGVGVGVRVLLWALLWALGVVVPVALGAGGGALAARLLCAGLAARGQ
jgi:alpha-1,3/alpha-1,6-mannosyltransferase